MDSIVPKKGDEIGALRLLVLKMVECATPKQLSEGPHRTALTRMIDLGYVELNTDFITAYEITKKGIELEKSQVWSSQIGTKNEG